MEYATDYDADIMLLSETWLRSSKNDITATVEEFGYTLKHSIRKNRAKETGGGVGILFKKSLNVKPVKSKPFQTFEHHAVRINVKGNKWVTYVSFYRLDYEPIDVFFKEFRQLLELTISEKCIIAGDINIHCDKKDDCHTRQLYNLLEAFDLTQMITEPTHRKGHTIDVLIARLEDTEIGNIEITDIGLSDHYLLGFSVDCAATANYYKTITFRKKVNAEEFGERLSTALETLAVGDNFGEAVTAYNSSMSELVKELAPEVTKTVKIVDEAPWFDTEYQTLKRERRKDERKAKKSKDPMDVEAFQDLRKKTTTMAKGKKQNHYISEIENAKNKPAKLFKVVNSLMDKEQRSVLPTSTSDKELANDFIQYFQSKIVKIRETFTSQATSDTSTRLPGIKEFSTFQPVTEEEVRTIVKKIWS